jgi:pimeloyl-ACP methyl ester carboxylesterase
MRHSFSDRRPDLLFLFAAIWQMSNGPSLKELGSVIQAARCIDAAAARNMPVPVLVVGGKEDPCFPPAEIAAAAAMFAHGTFVELKGDAHVATLRHCGSPAAPRASGTRRCWCARWFSAFSPRSDGKSSGSSRSV